MHCCDLVVNIHMEITDVGILVTLYCRNHPCWENWPRICRLVAFRRCYTDHPSVTFWIAGLNSGWPVYVLLLLFERLFVVVFLGCPGFSLGPTSQCYRFSIEPILLKTQKNQTNKPCFQPREEKGFTSEAMLQKLEDALWGEGRQGRHETQVQSCKKNTQ